MAIYLADRVKESIANNADTGIIILGGAETNFTSFSGALSNNQNTLYCIEDTSTNAWEVGIGIYNTGSVSRTTILNSSNSGNRISVSNAAKIFITLAADHAVYLNDLGYITGAPDTYTGLSFPDGSLQTTAYTGQTPYTAGTGLGLNGYQFYTDNTGTFDAIDFTISPTQAYQQGRVYYDSGSLTLLVYNDEAEIALPVGLGSYVRVRNNTGSTISKGKTTFINGSHGSAAPTIALASASSQSGAHVLGLAAHDIEDSTFGYVCTFGVINNLNTSAFSDGDEAFLAVESGAITGTAPTVPYYETSVAHIIRSHSSAGSLFVHISQHNIAGGELSVENGFIVSGVPFGSQAVASGGSLHFDNYFLYDSGNHKLIVSSGGIQFPNGNTQTIAYTGQEQAVSGALQSQITSNDNDISALQTASGNLDTRVTQNTANIVTVSGIAQTASNNVATASGYLQTQITSNDNDITALQTATGINASNISTASGYLQSQITSNDSDIFALQTATGVNAANITSLSGYVNNNFDKFQGIYITDGTNNGILTSLSTLTFSESGTISIAYDSGTNTITIGATGSGGAGGGTNWNLAVTGDSTNISDGETVSFTGQGSVSMYRSGNTVVISGTNYDLSSYATIVYVSGASGYLQSQITSNDNDITALQTATGVNASNISSSSGYLQSQITSNDSDITALQTATGINAANIASASGYLQSQITSNDSDITALQTATGINATNISTASGYLQSQITSNDNDISALQTATGVNAANIAASSGYLQSQITTNTNNITTVSGLLYNNWILSVTGNNDAITAGQTVYITGAGYTTVTYNSGTNTVTISGAGDGVGGAGGYDWIVADGSGNSETISSGNTVYFSGVGGTTVTYNAATNIVSISGAAGGAGTPAGSSGQIQYNNNGSFGGASQLLYNTTSGNILEVQNASGTAIFSVNDTATGVIFDIQDSSGNELFSVIDQTNTTLKITASASQTGNLVEVYSSAGSLLASIGPSGSIKFGVFTDANRGSAGTAGRVIFNSDDGKLNIDNGSNWTLADGSVT